MDKTDNTNSSTIPESETQKKINELLSRIEKSTTSTTTSSGDSNIINQNIEQQTRPFLFRNYNPVDNNLSKLKNSESVRFTKKLTEKILSEQIGSSFEFSDHLKKIDVSLTPKKQNYDLKRDIQPYLSVLAQRTSKAIGELIDEKIKLEEKEEEESEEEESDEDEDEDENAKKNKQKENEKMDVDNNDNNENTASNNEE